MDGSIWVGIGQKVEPASRSCRRWRSRRTPLAFSPGTLCHESFPTIRNSTPIDLLAMNRSAAGRFLERDANRPRDARYSSVAQHADLAMHNPDKLEVKIT